jgi:hypothetical protein
MAQMTCRIIWAHHFPSLLRCYAMVLFVVINEPIYNNLSVNKTKNKLI